MSKIEVKDLLPDPRKSISVRMIKNEDTHNSIVYINTSALLEEYDNTWYQEQLTRLVGICNHILEGAPVGSESLASFADPTKEESFKRALEVRRVN